MPLTLDGTATARAAAAYRGVAWLVELDFTGGTLRYTTWGYPVTSGGQTYTALGVLAGVGNVSESADSAPDRLALTLSVVNSAMLAAAMGGEATYRGKAARLYLQLFDEANLPAGAKVLRWQGYMDRVRIERQPATPDGDGGTGKIEMQLVRAGMARARNAEGLRLTDVQQQARYPGDTGLRYVRTLIEQPTLWLSKRFQEV